jgi:hypothetical protein
VLVLGVGWLIFAAVLSEKSIHPNEITDGSVTLVNVSPAFADALHTERATRTFMLPEVRNSGGVSVIAVAFLVFIVLIVCLGAISLIGKDGQNPPFAPGGFAAQQPVVDLANGFQLNHPGPGWFMVERGRLQRDNPLAMAGAVAGDIGGVVLVEPDDDNLQIAGNEQELGRALMNISPYQDKMLESIEPIRLHGRDGIRLLFTGRDGLRRVRVQSVAIVNDRRVYTIFTVGPVDRANRQVFEPFVNAFRLLP